LQGSASGVALHARSVSVSPSAWVCVRAIEAALPCDIAVPPDVRHFNDKRKTAANPPRITQGGLL